MSKYSLHQEPRVTTGKILLAIAVVWGFVFFGIKFWPSPLLKVRITAPEDGARVGRTLTVKGTLSDPQARLYLIVKPFSDRRYWWVQAPVTSGARWKATAILGGEREGIAEKFSLFVLASYRPLNLLPGAIDEIPASDAISNEIVVKRLR